MISRNIGRGPKFETPFATLFSGNRHMGGVQFSRFWFLVYGGPLIAVCPRNPEKEDLRERTDEAALVDMTHHFFSIKPIRLLQVALALTNEHWPPCRALFSRASSQWSLA
jgi:hypothetical protein